MDEKLKSSSKEKSIAEAYAAYMHALATHKHGPDKRELSDTKQRGVVPVSTMEQKKLSKAG